MLVMMIRAGVIELVLRSGGGIAWQLASIFKNDMMTIFMDFCQEILKL